jgi:hypothetical protein
MKTSTNRETWLDRENEYNITGGDMGNEGISRKRNERFRDNREEQGSFYDIMKIICHFSEEQVKE